MDTRLDRIMKAYAHDAVASAARRGFNLDYSEQSLVLVDELLGLESFMGTTPRSPESAEDEESLWTAAKVFGAYVGVSAPSRWGPLPFFRASFLMGRGWRVGGALWMAIAGIARASRAVVA